MAQQHLSAQNRDLEIQSTLQRKAVFLRYINKTIIYIHYFLLAYIFLLLFKTLDIKYIYSVLYILSSIGILIYTDTLRKKGKIDLSAKIISIFINVLIALTMLINLLSDSFDTAITFSYVLSLSILISAFIVNSKFSIIQTIVNIIFILAVFIPRNGVSAIIPITGFLIMITLIAWLYQRTLDNSMISLQEARQQLMQDTLIRQELAIARNLQQDLYPKPQHYSECLDIGASVQPALETSGDLYDLIRLNDDEIAIIVGDATGKSVAAAMVMAMTRSIIRSEARRSRNPGHVLRHVNAILHADDAVNQMMTVWYGVLNLRNHQLRFANAGHPFPLLRRNGTIQELEAFGTPLRSIRNFPYAEQTIQLQAKDRLVVYTDGVIETMNEQRELYSFDRWCTAVRELEAENTASLIDAYCADVDRFRGAARQADDLTLVIVDIIKDPSELITLPVADTTTVVVGADQ